MDTRGAGTQGLGLGPVFASEWITSTRRWQGYALRSLFVAGLLVALVSIWWNRGDLRNATIRQALASLGQQFYIAAVGTQLTLVMLAAPAATAGAICIDRARGTLTHLMVTDLSDREIVLGKLAARLVPVLALVGCTMPVMALLTLLGGVDPEAILGAFLVTVGVAVLGCSLALLLSLWVGKTHEALLGTYALWALWLLAVPMVNQFNRTFGLGIVLPFRTAEPFYLAFAPYWWPGTIGLGDFLGFLGVCSGISALLAAVAVARLRPVCTRENVKKKRPLSSRFRRFGDAVDRLTALARRLPAPSLDFNPVLWREWHRNRPSRLARSVGVLFVAVTLIFSLIAGFFAKDPGVAAWVNGLQVSVGMLFLSVTAATSLAEERTRGSLDVLMATTLSTREIVLGKWLGCFRMAPLMTILPVLVIIAGANNQYGRWSTLPVAIAYILCCGAAITSVGLALATWVSRLGRAVGLTITLYVFITVGWLFLSMMGRNGRGPGQEGLMMLSPFFGPGELTFEACVRMGMPAAQLHLGWGVVWTLFYAMAAVAFLVATLLSFNRCLGRVEYGLPFAMRLAPRMASRKKLKPSMIEEIAGEPLPIA